MYTLSTTTRIEGDQEKVLLMNLKTQEFVVLDNVNKAKFPRNLKELINYIMTNCNATYDDTLQFLYSNQFVCSRNENRIISLKYPYNIIVDNGDIPNAVVTIENLSISGNDLVNEIIIRNPDENYLKYAREILGFGKYLCILFDNYPCYLLYKNNTHLRDNFTNSIFITVNEKNIKEFLKELNFFTTLPSLTIIIDLFDLSAFSFEFLSRALSEYHIPYSFNIFLNGEPAIDENIISAFEKKLSHMYSQEQADFLLGFPLAKPNASCPKNQVKRNNNITVIVDTDECDCRGCSHKCTCKNCIYRYICYFRGARTSEICHIKNMLSKLLEEN